MLKVANSVINASQITGVLPVVNGGTGVTTSTGTGNVVLSAAPTLSGNVSLSTGNLIPGTAAKGINFTANTPLASMTSQLLNSYEEGTFTPVMYASGGTITVSSALGRYTRIGRQISCQGLLNIGSVSSPTGVLYIDALPFTNNATVSSSVSLYAESLNASATTMLIGELIQSTTSIRIQNFAAGAATGASPDVKAGSYFSFSVTYSI